MPGKNKVFIATSLDGYIADKNGEINWLHEIPNPDKLDLGYNKFIAGVDAIVMGRTTFETVCGLDIKWPYEKPVFVLSNKLTAIPEKFSGKIQLVRGQLGQVLEEIHKAGHHNLYIDGGKTIQGFLKEDLIDEMTITTIPYLLGGGFPLFNDLPRRLDFKCVDTSILLGMMVQNRYLRMR